MLSISTSAVIFLLAPRLVATVFSSAIYDGVLGGKANERGEHADGCSNNAGVAFYWMASNLKSLFTLVIWVVALTLAINSVVLLH